MIVACLVTHRWGITSVQRGGSQQRCGVLARRLASTVALLFGGIGLDPTICGQTCWPQFRMHQFGPAASAKNPPAVFSASPPVAADSVAAFDPRELRPEGTDNAGHAATNLPIPTRPPEHKRHAHTVRLIRHPLRPAPRTGYSSVDRMRIFDTRSALNITARLRTLMAGRVLGHVRELGVKGLGTGPTTPPHEEENCEAIEGSGAGCVSQTPSTG